MSTYWSCNSQFPFVNFKVNSSRYTRRWLSIWFYRAVTSNWLYIVRSAWTYVMFGNATMSLTSDRQMTLKCPSRRGNPIGLALSHKDHAHSSFSRPSASHIIVLFHYLFLKWRRSLWQWADDTSIIRSVLENATSDWLMSCVILKTHKKFLIRLCSLSWNVWAEVIYCNLYFWGQVNICSVTLLMTFTEYSSPNAIRARHEKLKSWRELSLRVLMRDSFALVEHHLYHRVNLPKIRAPAADSVCGPSAIRYPLTRIVRTWLLQKLWTLQLAA